MSVKAPKDWDKAVAVARYRMCGLTQADVAGIVGLSSQTISAYESSNWWSQALAEAARAEFSHIAAQALGVIKSKIEEGDATTARWFLSKVHPALSDKPTPLQGPEQKQLPGVEEMTDEELRQLASGEHFTDVEFDLE